MANYPESPVDDVERWLSAAIRAARAGVKAYQRDSSQDARAAALGHFSGAVHLIDRARAEMQRAVTIIEPTPMDYEGKGGTRGGAEAGGGEG